MSSRYRDESPIHPLWIAAGAAAFGAFAVRTVVRWRRHMELEGRVVLITGGSRGLGLVLARECVGRGATVCICARDEEELNRARADLQSRGGDVLAVQCDITVRPQIEELVRGCIAHFGTIDVLINNAGVIQVGPMEKMTIADYDEAMKTHFAAPLYGSLAVAPLMKARQSGRIVNITSIGGKVAAPHLLPYTASKFALVGFSEGLRVELAKDNVFVTTVVPGLMRTGSPRSAYFKGRVEEEFAWFSATDVLPIVSIKPERLARQILDAAQCGEAELITPWVASVQARIWGLMPGVASEVTALIDQALPSAGGIGSNRVRGYQAKSEKVPEAADRVNERAARANNEV